MSAQKVEGGRRRAARRREQLLSSGPGAGCQVQGEGPGAHDPQPRSG